MKSRLFLISCLVAILRFSSCGCGYPDPVEPQWHWFFFTGYEYSDNTWQPKLNQAFREENISFWHKRVKGSVERDAVEEALYDVYLLNNQTKNSFFRYLFDHQDIEAIRYWTLLKTSDSAYIHEMEWEQSVWYYSEKTGERYWYDDDELPKHDLSISQVTTLDESSILGCKDPDIRNRFLLQVMRKCFYVNDFQGCIKLWERYGKKVPGSVLRKQCLNYYGGALRRIDRDEEAAIVYAGIGFFDPRLHYDVEVMRKIYEKDPNNKAFEFMVQQFVNTYFDNSCRAKFGSRHLLASVANPLPDIQKSVAFNELAEKILRDGKSRNPALWKSAQAALAYINGETTAAVQLITEASKLRGTTATKDNVRMMRLVFNSTRTDNDANYEATILPDLQWLIQNIEKEGFPQWWEHELSFETLGCSYPKATLHRIKIFRRTILLGIVPHFEKLGMAYKSMAYLNLYEETMIDKDVKKVRDFARKGQFREDVNKYGFRVYFHPPIYREVVLNEYENSPDYDTAGTERTMLVADSITSCKNFDYSTLFFSYMDTTNIANVKRYVQFMRSGGKTAAEKFVLRRNYRDPSFYYELIATKYMRMEKYDSALVYLRKMSPDFPAKQNIADYIGGTRRNPFAEGWISNMKRKADFGLSFNPAAEYDKKPGKATFCQLMLRLRKMAASDPSAEIRAKAAYAYAVGYFRSTLGNAWALNYYEYGWTYGPYYGCGVPGIDEQLETNVHNRVDSWLDKALQYKQDEVFTMKCKILHSKQKKSVMRTVEKRYEWSNNTYTEEEFIPEVREMFCDQGCDHDPFCTDEWRYSLWYY